MTRTRIFSPLAVVLLILSISACTAITPTSSEIDNEPAETARKQFEEFDPSLFDENSINIDNQWWPLTPGTQFIYEGFTQEEGDEEPVPHEIIFTVTDLVKEINGVNTVVIYDRDYADGQLEGAELAFFTQDINGNVWHLGQYRETYEEGVTGDEFVAGRAWMVGHLEGAKAGIMMKANPSVDAPDYSQGYAPPPYNWTDRARTFKMGETVSVAAGDFENVLVSEEFNNEEPGAFQLKYYAPGVGNVFIGWSGDDTQREEMELVEIVELDAEALAEIRADALELEMHAYVYPDTPPAVQRTDMAEESNVAAQEVAATEDTPAGETEWKQFESFDQSLFDENSINIDNQWWPLSPGTQFIYEGFTQEEGDEEPVPHQIIFTVTDLVKEINGVNTVVIYDRDYADGQLEEAELAFYTQDVDGNVWHLGQYRETYEESIVGDELIGGRAWMVGHLEGAKAGIMMKANPSVDAPDYSQGYAPPPFNWTDRASTYLMGESVSVPTGTYENVLVTEEFNEEEPGAFQLKYYAPGVGNVFIGWSGDDTQREEMELVEIVKLDGDALAEIREEAMALEMHAYVYPHATPAKVRE